MVIRQGRFVKTSLFVIVCTIGIGLTACQSTNMLPTPPATEASLDLSSPLRPTAVPVPDFVLTDQDGQTFRLSDQRGYVVVLYFGYTHCPDICPTNLFVWSRVEVDLGSEAKRVRFVFITVDPDRDTPEVLRQFLNNFSPDFIGLTGTPAELEPVYTAFRIIHVKADAPNTELQYALTHSADMELINPNGGWDSVLTFGMSEQAVVQAIRELLR